MRTEKRSRWWLYVCDGVGCTLENQSHEQNVTPAGWVRLDPPVGWRGAPLVFCGTKHRDQWIDLFAHPPLIAEDQASAGLA